MNTIYQAFLSSREVELKGLREISAMPCFQNGFDPFLFEWKVGPALEITDYIKDKIKKSDVFIGIYGNEYGERQLKINDSNKLVSPIEFELILALEKFEKDDIFLFSKKGANRDPELNEMLNKFGLVCNKFDSGREFSLILDELLKNWIEEKNYKINISQIKENYYSISVRCIDQPGVLSVIYHTIYLNAGDVLDARQRVHFRQVVSNFVAKWPDDKDVISTEDLETTLKEKLMNLPNNQNVKVKVNEITDDFGVVRSRATIHLHFYDGPGIAEKIFRVISKKNLSVVESNLNVLSKKIPSKALFTIFVDFTNYPPENITMLSNELRKVAGVYYVHSFVENGQWWY